MSSLGEDSWRLVPHHLCILLHVPFPFVYLALYPFAVINLNQGYNYMLIPMNPFHGSLSLGLVLRTHKYSKTLKIYKVEFCGLFLFFFLSKNYFSTLGFPSSSLSLVLRKSQSGGKWGKLA